MSSKIISTVDLRYQSPNPQFPPRISEISFNPHLIRPRISTRKQSWPSRARVEALHTQTETKETLYELLGIAESGSSLSDIKKAYKQMARKYHPDVSPPERMEEYTRRFIMVHEAYETLSNPQARALYDRNLAVDVQFSSRKYHQKMEEKEEWKSMWQSQLYELQRRDRRGGTSWGARMRNSSSSFDY